MGKGRLHTKTMWLNVHHIPSSRFPVLKLKIYIYILHYYKELGVKGPDMPCNLASVLVIFIPICQIK